MNDEAPWTAEQIGRALEALRQRMDVERRAQFAPFGLPAECRWPASRVYHQHSSMGPEWTGTLTVAEVEALTLNLDYKRYPGAPTIALPRPEPLTASFEALIRRRRSARTFSRRTVSQRELAKLLELSAGVTAPLEVPRRAAPSPGGLYPVEVYPLVFSLEALTPGVYHYAALDHALELVRPVAGFDVMREFLPPDLFDSGPPLVLALTVVFARVQAKYLERGYRFALLEAGHIAQNILLAATALDLHAVPVGGFWDEPFNALLGLEPATEAVVYAILIGGADREPDAPSI
ncbi:SagB/ThcOx family dehydrogenase [Nannocystis pusilla]|uniref:SagB/ThcOx family dehydrogenase n=1 Tax=Nannocystis pusilla TaxID=889268 RepID=UPI003DA5F9AB